MELYCLNRWITQSQAKFILPVSVGLTNEYKFTFDINLSNNNINKHPQFAPYENFDYKIKVACPTSWKNGVLSNAINFSLSCSPPDNSLTKALIWIQSTRHLNFTMTAGAQKQHLSSALSNIKNIKQLRIINSSYTTISNNSALQVLFTLNNAKNLERHTVTSDGYYTIVYSADSPYFNKYLPIAQKVMDLLQIKGNPLPARLEPGLGPLPELPQPPRFPQLPPDIAPVLP